MVSTDARLAPRAIRAAAGTLLIASVVGCAHGAPTPAAPGRALASEAGQIGTVTYEDDFTEARLIFQALPLAAKERGPLRAKLLHYLLDPVLVLQPAALRREVRDLENDDVYDVIF